MKHTKRNSRIVSIALATILTCTAASMPAAAITQESTGIADFELGNSLPWVLSDDYVKMAEGSVENGAYKIVVTYPDAFPDDTCELRHSGITLRRDHVYHVHAEIKASNDGDLYASIGDSAGDRIEWRNTLGATEDASYTENSDQWALLSLKANEPFTVDARFSAEDDLEDGVFQFELGYSTVNPAFPRGTELFFDNLYIYDETADKYITKGTPDCNYRNLRNPDFDYPVAVNQLGYLPNAAKKAVAHFDAISKSQGFDYAVINAETACSNPTAKRASTGKIRQAAC